MVNVMNATLTRRRRTRILIEGESGLKRGLAAEIEARHKVESAEEPRQSLVMLKLRDGGRCGLFYAGEYLVSEARVIVEGVIGIGIIGGDDEEGSRELAIVDAAFKAGFPEAAAWTERLLEEERRISDREAADAGRIARTRVSFESMQEERPLWAST
jgi:alpha-D-ribose 1-methylphosphonate 5-triphosphate synthase subunit PhnG